MRLNPASLATAVVALALTMSGARADEGNARAPVEDIAKTSAHVLKLGNKSLAYKPAAGTLTLHNDDGDPTASMFYVAYTVEQPKGAPQRPVTFFFNGGPG